MKNKNYIYTYLFTLIGGILLIILHNRSQIFEAISIILGIGFMIVGILSLISAIFISEKAREAGAKRSPVLIIVSGASLVLGTLMVVAPTFFINYLVYTLGFIMILCGLIQLCNFMPRMSILNFSWIFLIVPCLSLLAGLVVFTVGADDIKDMLALLTGIVLTIYSVNGFIGYFNRRSRLKAEAKYDKHTEIIDIN